MNIILGLKNKKNKNYNYLMSETINSMCNLHLSLINNVFSDEECSNLIIYSENVGYVQASSYIDKYKNFRTHKLHMFHEANKIENIIRMLNLLEEHFLQEYPFFTFYLPENIKEFEDFIVIRDDGNCCEIIARSKDYFYHFQKFN